MAARIVIVGGVAGGASAAARARRMSEEVEIVMIERDAYISFASCGLPYHIGQEIEERDALLVTTPERMMARFRIDVRTRQEVTRIDREGRQVEVRRADGERYMLSYDKLILATGSSPVIPPIAGVHARGVMVLRSMGDMDRINEAVGSGEVRRAVVVGAGYIGLELAEQLRRRGLEVVVVEQQGQVLPLLDEEIAAPVEEALRAEGVLLRLGVTLREVIAGADGAVTGVVLGDGEALEAELVLLGIGVRANAELAREAGLRLHEGRAIWVDEVMRTSDPAIYAVGDAAVYPCALTGAPRWLPLAGPANRAGRLAGEHAATGRSAAMGGVLGTSIVRVFGQAAGITGLHERAAARLGLAARSVTILGASHASYYPGAATLTLKLVYEEGTGRVLGLQVVGADGVDKRLDVAAAAIAGGMTVEQLSELDLAYAPPFGSAKDPIHQAAFAACNELAGLVRFEPATSDLEGMQVVDVRGRGEVEAAPLGVAGALNIPLDALREEASGLRRDVPTVMVCAVGKRGYFGARVLRGLGFEDVRVLSGGQAIRARLRR